MEANAQRSTLEKAANRIKCTIGTVKITPYLFLVVYCICLILECFGNIEILSVVNKIYGCSVGMSFILLIMSKTLGLCIWHKTACIIPSSSVVLSFIDDYIISLSQEEVFMSNIIFLVFTFCYIVVSFIHFYRHG